MRRRNPACGRQRGAALVVGLIFLAMLSLMGVAAYMVATQEERMSGNSRDRIRAFEAAEASLRDCESVLEDPTGMRGPRPITFFNGIDGMHLAPAFGSPQVYETIDWVNGSVRVIPQISGAAAIPGVALQPRCIIERIGDIAVQSPDDARSGPQQLPSETFYRITAMGYGASPRTTATLQTTFRDQ